MKNNYGRFKIIVLISLILLLSVITWKATAANAPNFLDNQNAQQEVTGVVTGPQGLPIAGVAVFIKGETKGTVTNVNGEYTIQATQGDTLVFTYLGFKPVEVILEQASTLNIQMEEDVASLGEVEINAGYYNTTRRESTGNISRVTAEEIELQPVISPLQALQGRMAGVEIDQSAGVSGLASSIIIRGRNSLRFQGDYPLFIIDGVPVNSSPISSIGPFTRGAGIDPLNALNMSNIESIEVLKDADATAIYGSRGANGVVLITTRKGSDIGGKTTFEVQGYSGFSEVSNKMKLMNTSQYISVREKAFENDGVVPSEINAPDLVLWDQNRYTDWQEVLLGGTASIKDFNVAVTGGDENTSFLVGGSFHNEGAVFPGNFGYKKMTANINLNHNSKSQRFQMVFSANYGLDNNDLFYGTNYVNLALTLSPNAPALYNDDGTLNWEDGTWTNPFAGLYKPQEIKTSTLLSNLSLSYEMLDGLKLKANMGYSNLGSEEEVRNLKDAYNPRTWDRLILSSNNSTTQRTSWIIEPQILYNRNFGSLELDALAGATFQNSENNMLSLEGLGFSDDRLVGNLGAADEVRVNLNEDVVYRYAAVFGRLGFNWSRKYFLNLTGRRDGSSRFGRDKRFASFWALGTAWIFSEEEYFKNNIPFLSFGKIRGSYGTTGSDQIPDYGYLDTYEATPGPGGLYPTQLTNPDYSWEVNRKLEAALQLGFNQDKINLEVSWYRNRSSNQLVGYPLSAITGFTSVQANLPALIQNKGWEIVLSSINVQTKNFSWETSLNATFPSNKLLEFDDLNLTPYRETYKVGYPLDISLRYKYDGIDPETGLYRIADVNNDGRFDINDRVSINRLGRKYYGGISNILSFRNLDLGVLFEYVRQERPTYLAEMSNSPGRFGNNSTDILDAWRQEGDATNVQRLSQSIPSLLAYYNVLNSDLFIGDASFLRLKTLELSYNLPATWLTGFGIERLNLFVHGQNLLTITNYKGLDPQGGKVVPPLRTITSGVQINF